jgi:hypothetical protein
MGETRVNLRHLLEDIRDSYPFPQEEAIITELVANALDSGASQIAFRADGQRGALMVFDNGAGMGPTEFVEYHDIAATTKTRGKGIGFAGVGAKLSLLVAQFLVTETRKGEFHKASRWKLESATRAPWDYVSPPGLVRGEHGTAVLIRLGNQRSALIQPEFIADVVRGHFYPILDREFMDNILRRIYRSGVSFSVNGAAVELPPDAARAKSKRFFVRLGKKGTPVGVGFLRKGDADLAEGQWGLAVSTYGKVIKRGWDWTGIAPRHPMQLSGLVEVPVLSEILTLNKADFLKDAPSLQKYYRYRKAIQEAVEPILRQMGEARLDRERVERDMRPLEKVIERVLQGLIDDFPELSPLLGRRPKGQPIKGVIGVAGDPPVGSVVEGVEMMTGPRGGGGEGDGIETAPGTLPGQRIDPTLPPTMPGHEHEGRRRRPGIMIGFDERQESEELGWLTENTIWVNTAHPTYQAVADSETETYHVVVAVAWVLSGFLQDERSPQAFISRFLSSWASRA